MLDALQSPMHIVRASRRPTGAKLALKPLHVWGIRIRLQVADKCRDLALFDLALDSKLRGCDLVALRVGDVVSASGVRSRVMILQRKTGRPVQFEITEQTRRSLEAWIEARRLRAEDWLFPSRSKRGVHLSTRQYARLVDAWVRASRPRSNRLRHPQPAPDQGLPALHEDGQSPRVSAPIGPHEAREHGQIPLGVEVDDALALSESLEL